MPDVCWRELECRSDVIAESGVWETPGETIHQTLAERFLKTIVKCDFTKSKQNFIEVRVPAQVHTGVPSLEIRPT